MSRLYSTSYIHEVRSITIRKYKIETDDWCYTIGIYYGKNCLAEIKLISEQPLEIKEVTDE